MHKRDILFFLFGLLIFFLGLYLLKAVLLPFAVGILVGYFLDPVADRLEEWGLSRTTATGLITLCFLVGSLTGLLVIFPVLQNQIRSFLGALPTYADQLTAQLKPLVALFEARFSEAGGAKLHAVLESSSTEMVKWLAAFLGRLLSGGAVLLNFISLLFITPIVAFYFLRDWDRMVEKIDTWLPRPLLKIIRGLAVQIDQILAGFIRGQASVCLILGLFYAMGLSVIGLDLGLLIGFSAGIISFVPYLGSIAGFVVSIGVALAQFTTWEPIAMVAAVFFIGQAVEGNFLTPRLVGNRVQLHPVWVIFALLAGGSLFGFFGVLVAVPFAAVAGVLTRFALSRYLESRLYDPSA